MSKEGTTQARLDRATEALEAEMEEWKKANIDVGNWQMGPMQFYMVCQVKALYQVMRDILGVDNDLFTAVLREVTLEEMTNLRTAIIESKKNDLQRRLTEGIMFRPPPDILGPNGGKIN